MMEQIEQLIEAEVERRIRMSIDPFLLYISKTYDISVEQLHKDYSRMGVPLENTRCKGVTKSNKSCTRAGKVNGYCMQHQSQYKEVTKIPLASLSVVKHTHTCPPLYMPGCPACHKKKPIRDLADCFINE